MKPLPPGGDISFSESDRLITEVHTSQKNLNHGDVGNVERDMGLKLVGPAVGRGPFDLYTPPWSTAC